MKIGKLIQIGQSLAIVIPKATLRQLGWMRGDHIVQQIEDGKVVMDNLHRRTLKFTSTRAEYGDSVSRGT
jgi:antitoxin component of MazEF toxin-antitoxin module